MEHLITFAPIHMGLIISFVIIRFEGVTNVTGCYSVTPPPAPVTAPPPPPPDTHTHHQIANMPQNACKIIGLRKTRSTNSSRGKGGKQELESGLVCVF